MVDIKGRTAIDAYKSKGKTIPSPAAHEYISRIANIARKILPLSALPERRN